MSAVWGCLWTSALTLRHSFSVGGRAAGLGDVPGAADAPEALGGGGPAPETAADAPPANPG